jgi:hypothetical protein
MFCIKKKISFFILFANILIGLKLNRTVAVQYQQQQQQIKHKKKYNKINTKYDMSLSEFIKKILKII